jgi:S-methylmethionine-dependent homocysteine/selenocysteine methylase
MITVIDGGLSTALAELGVDTSGGWWTADALRTAPYVLEAAHRAFVAAGARVVTSASYQCPSHEHEALRASTAIARRAAGDDARVAASIGPFGAWLADGSEYTGRYDVPLEVMRSRHTERIRVLTGTNVDLFAVETQPRADEAEMIAEILVDHGAPPAWFSFGCRDGSTTYGGDDVLDAVRRIADYPDLVAVGVNCGSPDVVDAVVSSLAPLGLPMVAYPNHGRSWDASARAWTGEAADLADEARLGRWQRAGVTMVGGCCGVGPAELERLARSCAVLG